MIGEEKTILSEKIVNKILEDVKSGVLKPGDMLPSEKKLIEIYKVNRNSIREALRTLKIMNVIDICQGKGAFVTSLDPGQLVQHLEFVFDLDDSDIYTLFEARRIVEPEIAALAAMRVTDEMIGEMKELIRNDYHVDIILHEKIALSSQNPVLIRFISSLYQLGESSRKVTSAVPVVREKTHDQHIGLVDAIASRNPELARKKMEEHLEFVVNSYRKYISEAGEHVRFEGAHS